VTAVSGKQNEKDTEMRKRKRRQVMKQVLSCLALVVLAATSAWASGDGLYAEYRNLGGTTVIRTVDGEGSIVHGFSWDCLWAGKGNSSYEGQCGLWAGTWDGWGKFEETLTGYLQAPKTGAFTFYLGADDYLRMTFEGEERCYWDGPYSSCSFAVDLVEGQFYEITIEFKNRWGSCNLGFWWDLPDGTGTVAVPREYLYTEIPLIAVAIDIKPGSFPNSMNLTDRGLLPVAILGSAEFDVEMIDPETINVGGVSLALRGSTKAPKFAYSYEDVNGDGVTDLMAFFDLQVLVTQQVLTETTGALEISGSLYEGTFIKGMDSVKIVH
jgi:hypothetical protein